MVVGSIQEPQFLLAFNWKLEILTHVSYEEGWRRGKVHMAERERERVRERERERE